MASPRLRVFISSPGDVGLEREISGRVIERLRGKFGSHFDLESVRWEREPVRATDSFQAQIERPSQCDIVVCILWSRLGTPLSDAFRRPDGSRFGSGTEWEFEDAVQAYRERGLPDLLVYRRTQEPEVSLKDDALIAERQAQYRALEAFVQKWFFNDDGTFRAAFKSYVRVDEFEHLLENDLHRVLLERLEQRGASEDDLRPTVHWPQGSPFLGLRAFGVEHAQVFHGRTRAIGGIREAMVKRAAAGCASVVVFGMSGCGKSSLVRAGAIATITRPGVVEGAGPFWWCDFRPSDAPADLTRGLASAVLSDGSLPGLREMGVDAGTLGAMLAANPDHAAVPIGMALSRAAEDDRLYAAAGQAAQPRLIVLVDQLEELFTLSAVTAEARRGFVRALVALARSGRVWVIATMRSDVYHRCAEVPELCELKEGAGQFDLLPPTFDEVGQVIAYPAQAAGLRFEHDAASGRRLDAVLHEAAGQTPEVLPLLSFVLDELYRARTDAGVLTFAAYEALGGIDGAIAQRAEAVFGAQTPGVQAELRPLMRALATVEGEDDLVVARRVPVAQAGANPERRAMLDAMVAARLLGTDRTDDGTPVVRVAHEAVLGRWPRVADWLAEDREFLRVRARVAEAAGRWRAEGRRPDRLLPAGKPLAEADALVATRPEELDPGIAEYVAASSAAHRRRRRARAVTLTLLAVGVTAAGLISYKEWDDGRKAKVAAGIRQKAAARETQLGLELQARNRELKARNERTEKRLSFDRLMSNGGFNLIGRNFEPARNGLREAVAIAEPLAAEPGEERSDWIRRYHDALTKLAEAEFGLGRFEDGQKTLRRRPEFANGRPVLREGTGELEPAAGIVLNEYHVTFARLQLELLIANEHLKALLQQNELLKEALNQRMSRTQAANMKKAEAKRESPSPAGAAERNKHDAIQRMLGTIGMAELVFRSTGDSGDREMLDFAYSNFAADLVKYWKDPGEALKLVRRRIDFDRQQLEKLGHQAPKAAQVDSKLAAKGRDQIAAIWLSLSDAYRQSGEIHAAMNDTVAALADFKRAIETIEKADLPPERQRESATKVADLRFRAADLMRAQHEEASAARELHAGVGLLLADGAAAVWAARRGQVKLVVKAAENLARLGETSAGRACYGKAVALMTALAEESHEAEDWSSLRSLHAAHVEWLASQGDVPAGRAAFEAALADWKRRASASKDIDVRATVAWLHGAFTAFLVKHKDAPGALEHHARAAEAYRDLARTTKRRDLYEAADAQYRDWISLLKTRKDPAVVQVSADRIKVLGDWRDALGRAADAPAGADEWRRLAAAYAAGGNREEAVNAARESVRLFERLAAGPAGAERRRTLPMMYFRLAGTCLELGDENAADDALDHARGLAASIGDQAMETGERLMILAESARVKDLRHNRAAAVDLARQGLAIPAPTWDARLLNSAASRVTMAYRTIARVMDRLGEHATAHEALEQAIELARKFLDAAPGDIAAVQNLARSYEARGDLRWNEKAYPAAEADYSRMLDVLQTRNTSANSATAVAAPLPALDMGSDAQELLARAYDGLGCMRDMQKKDPGAREAFEQLIAIRARLAGARPWELDPYKRLRAAYRRLENFATTRRDYALAYRAAKGEADALEQAVTRSDNPALADELSGAILSQSWYALWAHKPADAESAARRGMAIESLAATRKAMLATNLAHSQLFQGRWDEAVATYREHRNEKVDDKRTFADAVLEDFRQFHKEGLTHPDLERTEQLLFSKPEPSGSP